MSAEDRSAAGRVDAFESVTGELLLRIQTSLAGNHPYLTLIGRVASEWTHFENILDDIIINLSDLPDDTALCITRHLMGAAPRFKMIESLGKLRGVPESILKKARKLKSDQFETGEHRNRIVHDPWFVVQVHGSESIETKQLKATGYEPVSEKEIYEVIEHIKSLIARAADLQIEFRMQYYSSAKI